MIDAADLPPSVEGGPAPWLVAIDLQHGFRTGPWATPGFDAVVPRVVELADSFGDRVVLTRFVPAAEPHGSWAAYDAAWPFARQADAATWDVVDAVAATDRRVVSASTMGKWGADLTTATGGVTDLVLCGVSTDCCVLSTALAAADAGAFVRVVAEACAGVSAESHRRALDAMAAYAPQITVL